MGKEEIACLKQFLPFPQYFNLFQSKLSLYFHRQPLSIWTTLQFHSSDNGYMLHLGTFHIQIKETVAKVHANYHFAGKMQISHNIFYEFTPLKINTQN